jgi:hypothetical protein
MVFLAAVSSALMLESSELRLAISVSFLVTIFENVFLRHWQNKLGCLCYKMFNLE